MGSIVDLTGQRFGRLVVLSRTNERSFGHIVWHCMCDCGNEIDVTGNSLKDNSTKSCGCLRRDCAKERIKSLHESSVTHNMANTRLYKIWCHIKTRCFNSNFDHYKDYGGRGVKICNEWIDNFENFAQWALENGYDDNLSIDRIDVNGDYEPSNCRWVDIKTQQNNRRNNRLITYNGKTQTMKQWAEELNIKYATLAMRITQRHWDIEKALTTPVKDF